MDELWQEYDMYILLLQRNEYYFRVNVIGKNVIDQEYVKYKLLFVKRRENMFN